MLPFLLLLLFFPIVAFWNFLWKRRGLPPGPTPVPFFGNTLSMKTLYEPFQRWTREYGPIYTVWMGECPQVMVTEYDMLRDLFVKEGNAFAGRHFFADLFKQFRVTNGKKGGISFVDGEPWKVARRFGLQAMRNLGMGRSGLEQQFLTDMSSLIDKLGTELAKGKAEVDLQLHIDRLTGSIINRLLFGYAFSDNQVGEYYEMKAGMDRLNQLLSTLTGSMLMNWPSLRHFPFFSATFASLDNVMDEIFAQIRKPIDARMAKRAAKQAEWREPRDVLDYFLDKMEAAKTDPELAKHFNLDTLPQFCFDLLLGGMETTCATLGFLVLYVLLDQRVQAKMHAELDRLEAEKSRNGNGGGPTMMLTSADRPKLPYLNAVIKESQRLCNLIPINLSHRTMCDVQVQGGRFELKKGTIVVPQMSCVLFDEKIFPNPLRFQPERFLDEKGQLKRSDELIPFSIGKRMCMGESLARMEMFLFTANFFRHFQVLPVDVLNPPTVEKRKAVAVSPHPYECRLVARMSQKEEEKLQYFDANNNIIIDKIIGLLA